MQKYDIACWSCVDWIWKAENFTSLFHSTADVFMSGYNLQKAVFLMWLPLSVYPKNIRIDRLLNDLYTWDDNIMMFTFSKWDFEKRLS